MSNNVNINGATDLHVTSIKCHKIYKFFDWLRPNWTKMTGKLLRVLCFHHKLRISRSYVIGDVTFSARLTSAIIYDHSVCMSLSLSVRPSHLWSTPKRTLGC